MISFAYVCFTCCCMIIKLIRPPSFPLSVSSLNWSAWALKQLFPSDPAPCPFALSAELRPEEERGVKKGRVIKPPDNPDDSSKKWLFSSWPVIVVGTLWPYSCAKWLRGMGVGHSICPRGVETGSVHVKNICAVDSPGSLQQVNVSKRIRDTVSDAMWSFTCWYGFTEAHIGRWSGYIGSNQLPCQLLLRTIDYLRSN